MAKPRKEDARSAAARAIDQVLAEGRSLAAVLPPALHSVPPAERGLTQELCYGTLRWAPRLEALAARLLDKPLRARDSDVHALLLVGLYQLLYLNVPPHAAVSLTVDATVKLKKEWARGLLNGVLRRLLREQEPLLAAVDASESAALAHPAWLLARCEQDWPEDWRAIAAANNAHPPMTLRVNRRQDSREGYLARLAAAGITATAVTQTPDAITLATPMAVEQLPGFAAGAVSVQDAAAQLAAGLLQLAPGQRVLDACAAPGGKTGHMLETCPDIELLALDSEAERLQRVAENLARLQLEAELHAGDAGDPSAWWDGRPFDRILLDAPCSGSGVIRRHPDIKALRRAEDITTLAAQQARLLRALWPLLAPGGILVYATCSILTAENAGQVTAFLRDEAQAQELPITASWGRAVAAGRQILPGENGMDGFYYAVLRKA
ncbi:MAG: 16S rRNA (cytosine(967)-C(5))-methyltransferase RsmB [Thiohalomonadaceae bacterium]